jgi:hypothetical protein
MPARRLFYQITNTSNDNILSDISVGPDGMGRMAWSVPEATNAINVYAVSFPSQTTTQVTSSQNPSTVGQPVTFTASVSSQSGAGTPTGTVQFKDNATNMGSPQPLNSSDRATFSTSSLSVGSHAVEADYSGGNTFTPSLGSVSQTVNAPPDAPLTIRHIGAIADRNGGAAAGVTFTDADPQGTLSQYNGTIDWGDRSPATPAQFAKNPFGGFAAGGLHQYSAAGSYTVVVTIRDIGGATVTKTTILVVSAPR